VENELEKIASSVETDGYSEDKELSIEKIAQANFLLRALEDDITKEAGFGQSLGEGMAATAMIGLGVSAAGRAIDKVESSLDQMKFNRKKDHLISYARKENPSLKGVSSGKMSEWLDSAYVVSPRVAKDPVLASTYLNTLHAVGGADLNTVKTLADIQQKGGKSYDKSYDALRGTSNTMTGLALSDHSAVQS